MQQFTPADLTMIMRSCAGMAESAQLSGADLEETYADLGYDSLAVLEIQAQIQQQYGIRVGDEAVDHMPTPAATLSYVNMLILAGA
jgi:act minimal PKS acyl carrier protein